MEEYEEEEMGRSSSRAEVALALAEEDESGLGSSKREGMLIFVWRMEGEIVHRHGSGPSRGGKQGAERFFPDDLASERPWLFTYWSVHAFRKARRGLKVVVPQWQVRQ